FGCDSKEAYSAELAMKHTQDLDLGPKYRAKVCAAIMATKRDGSFVSAEQKVVRAADLAGLAASYETFLLHNVALWSEQKILGNPISWMDWKRQSEEIISFYLSQEIRLTSYYSNGDGMSAFHQATKANLKRLREEPCPS
ncbi:MAG: hypothetical protein AAF387_05840, partial [Pseudomonadota bacterium]